MLPQGGGILATYLSIKDSSKSGSTSIGGADALRGEWVVGGSIVSLKNDIVI